MPHARRKRLHAAQHRKAHLALRAVTRAVCRDGVSAGSRYTPGARSGSGWECGWSGMNRAQAFCSRLMSYLWASRARAPTLSCRGGAGRVAAAPLVGRTRTGAAALGATHTRTRPWRNTYSHSHCWSLRMLDCAHATAARHSPSVHHSNAGQKRLHAADLQKAHLALRAVWSV